MRAWWWKEVRKTWNKRQISRENKKELKLHGYYKIAIHNHNSLIIDTMTRLGQIWQTWHPLHSWEDLRTNYRIKDPCLVWLWILGTFGLRKDTDSDTINIKLWFIATEQRSGTLHWGWHNSLRFLLSIFASPGVYCVSDAMLAWPLALLFAVAMRATQLRFERHPSVHEVFLNMWCERNHNDTSFCQV